METSLVFIHGFLGQPSDWQLVAEGLSGRTQYFIDLNKDFDLADFNFQNWPQAFQEWLEENHISGSIAVVGYSMGGRLGLPLLESKKIDSLFVLSGHLGLPEDSISLRSERKEFNKKWALRFLNEDWNTLMKDWNEQSIFAGSTFEPLRLEHHYDRQKLAAMLTGFSLSEQKDYGDLMNSQNIQLLVGEQDKKYLALAKDIKSNFPGSQVEILQNAGHRVIFDQPQIVADLIQKILY